ncbi:MAG: bacteriophage abortive infection AbiH family protein, partial [Flavobacterium sp.]|uniref:AbiH family protein n=1 Tax=Flavobacterium sp. TaxID=239 RepID=UPI0025C110DF
MNRLVIIGNGFDLAHGLPTSYKDFIDDYWKTACNTNGGKKIDYKDNLVAINCEFGYLINDDEMLAIEKINNFQEINNFINRNKSKRDGVFEIKFHNNFYKIICESSTENWVDIENLYYDILKNISNSDFRKYNYPWGVNQLNNEFGDVKSLLEKYLIDNIEEKFEFKSNDIIETLNIFKPKTYIGNELNELYNEISIKSKKRIEEEYQLKVQKSTGFSTNNFSGQKIHITNYFLSFNYTSTMKKYIDFLKIDNGDLNEIHGSVIEKLNPINFGFGDEMDNDYKQIEDKNDNEYLKNIKSFQYLHTQNYKRLL